MSEKENPFKRSLYAEKINQIVTKYFEKLAGDIRKSIERTGITGKNPKDEANHLIRTITGFDILSSVKTKPEVIAKALEDVPRRVLIAAENQLMKKERTGILNIVLKAIRLKLGRET